MSTYSHSMVVGTLTPTDLGSLRKADGEEEFKDLAAEKAAAEAAAAAKH